MARGLGPLERASDEQPIGSDDLLDLSHSTRDASRFLGIYGPDGDLAAMRAHGLVARLEAMGFRHVGVELDLADPFEHTLRVYDGEPARRLGEIIAARRHVEALGGVELPPGSEVIEIGWLAIGNPDGHLATPLPRQERPGLGLLRAVIEMALAATVALRLAGVICLPAHYHLASGSHPLVPSARPARRGRLPGAAPGHALAQPARRLVGHRPRPGHPRRRPMAVARAPDVRPHRLRAAGL